MDSSLRHYSALDKLIMKTDQGLRTLLNAPIVAQRHNPAESTNETTLTQTEKKHSAGLMRVDHTGEVCAQALYQGQAFSAHSPAVKNSMQKSAEEENDHLAWCSERLQQLDSHPSYLNPLWYASSFLIGAIAGALGDKWSLGFVVETERQVEQHLQSHLNQLPTHDEKSRVILQQMQQDEAHHATVALESGAAELPITIKQIMRIMSKIMTTTAYWI